MRCYFYSGGGCCFCRDFLFDGNDEDLILRVAYVRRKKKMLVPLLLLLLVREIERVKWSPVCLSHALNCSNAILGCSALET